MAIKSPIGRIIEPTRNHGHHSADVNFGFTLSFISGRAMLTCRDKTVGPCLIKVLELEIPDIEFPFDVTGGADRFKPRRCKLRHLALSLDSEALSKALQRATLKHGGFLELRSAIRDGFVELGGRFAIGEHQADFTGRAALLINSSKELSLVFFDLRLYGWLPIAIALLPVYLQQALEIPYVSTTRAGAWTLTPVDDFLKAALPRGGWKVPDTRQVGLTVADSARGRMTIAAGASHDPTAKQRHEREPPAEALRAGEGIATFTPAEKALARGDFTDAYQRYREAWDDERGGRWVRERLLQLGAADPELALETRQLANEILADDPDEVQSLLALSSIAMRERSWGEAAIHYARLAEIARRENRRYDIVASELAGAAAAGPVDAAAALAGYERAAARARDSLVAHEALFNVRRANQDWDGAAKAGERLVRLLQDKKRIAELHRQLGVMHRTQRGDLKRARINFEKALKIDPDDPAALEGLAETYAARGEPARAATYLARLTEHAETSGEAPRIVALNLRLGEIWERWLGDDESATRRYQRVLDIEPNNRSARLQLASLAEKRGDWMQARALYEDLLASEEERGDPDATSDLVRAYTRLARVTLETDGTTPEAVASLERAVELDPSNRAPRDELARVMRQRGEWSRLVRLLEEAAQHSKDSGEARAARLDAAKLQLAHGGDSEPARRHLALILDHHPDDPEALELLMPLLVDGDDVGALVTRLEQAADVTSEPTRRGCYLLRLAEIRRKIGLSPESEQQALEAALDADPYLLDAAERLVELVDGHHDLDRVVHALARLAVANDAHEAKARFLVRRAQILWRDLDRVEEAERAFRRALRFTPGDLAVWNQLSYLYAAEGRADEAMRALEQALHEAEDRGLDTTAPYQRIAELARDADDREAEANALMKTITAGSRTSASAERLVQVLIDLNRGHEATELLEAWAKDSDDNDADELRFRAAAIHETLGELELAVHGYADLITADGDRARDAAHSLARLAREGNHDAHERIALEYLIDHSDDEEAVAMLEQLVDALHRHDDPGALELRARQLLESDQHSPVAHLRLAERCLADHIYRESLNHYTHLLLETPPERLDPSLRCNAFLSAAALACEIEPALVKKIEENFKSEFPEASTDALHQPLSHQLRDQQRWEDLYRLRMHQLQWVEGQQKQDYEADVAQILDRHLDRPEEAIAFYQSVIAAQDAPSDEHDALVNLLERIGRHQDLADHLFAISQRQSDRGAALACGLRSARVYGEALANADKARQILTSLLDDPDYDWRYPHLIDALRDFEMSSELLVLLERSLDQEANPDDGRLDELVTLLLRVGEPQRALAWAERIAADFPENDRGWHIADELLAEFPELGDRKAQLEVWANARSGPAKVDALEKLASEWHREGDFEREFDALKRAAEVAPTSISILERLVERATARGDWPEVLRWLMQLAEITEEVTTRDHYWRRVVDIAVDYAGDPPVAIRALEALGERSTEEERALVDLYIEAGHVAGLASSVERIRDESVPDQQRAAQAAFNAGELDLARKFFGFAMGEGAEREIWSSAAQLWHAAGKSQELAQWRLDRAEAMDLSAGAWLRLEAYAELLESGFEPDGLEGLSDNIQAAGVNEDVDVAWAVFRIGRALDEGAWQDRGARALESMLAADDSRGIAVLEYRASRELTTDGNFEEAIELAQQLLRRGAASGIALLERGLTLAGRRSDLVELLITRVDEAPDTRAQAALWVRIAKLRAELDEWMSAARALEEVSSDVYDHAWAQLAADVGQRSGARRLQLRGILFLAQNTTETEAKGRWYREAGSLALHELHDYDQGVDWLRTAQELDPQDPFELASALGTLEIDEAERRLAEAMLIFQDADAIPLWRYRFERALEVSGNRDEAFEALDTIAELTVEDDAAAWFELSKLASRVESVPRQRSYLARAYQHDRNLEALYLRLVSLTGGADEVIDVLVARGDELEGRESAARFEQAARLADMRLGDKPRALALFERAVEEHGSRENLTSTLQLAATLGYDSRVVAVGRQLLEQIESDDPERLYILRSYIDALYATDADPETHSTGETGDNTQRLTSLRELVARDAATTSDRIRLAALVEHEQPDEAAELCEAAARASDNVSNPRLLIDAAQRWRSLGEDQRAVELLRLARQRGVNSLESAEIAAELESGEPRLEALLCVVTESADSNWSNERRHQVRVELATWLLERGSREEALHLILAAEAFGKSPAWVRTMEWVWIAEENDEQLAQHRLDTLLNEPEFWPQEERHSKILESIRYFRDSDDATREYQTLGLLLRDEPDNDDAQQRRIAVSIQLGDLEAFAAAADEQWTGTSDPSEKVELALHFSSVLTNHFDAPELGRDFLRRSYELEPSLRLAEATFGLGVDTETLRWLGAGSSAIDDEDTRSALELRLANVAEEHGDDSLALEIYQRIFDRDPTEVQARDRLIAGLLAHERWEELVDAHQRVAKSSDDATARISLSSALEIIDRYLDDNNRWLALAQDALALDPTNLVLATQLAERHILAGHWQQARFVVRRQGVDPERELELLKLIASGFAELGEEDERAEVISLIAERHPDSVEAQAIRLERARESGDQGALLEEIEFRLTAVADLDDHERHQLHTEAGALADDLGDQPKALAHYVATLDTADPTPVAARRAVELALGLDSEDDLSRALRVAARMREQIMTEAIRAKGEDRASWFVVLGKAHEFGNDEPAAVEAYRRATAGDANAQTLQAALVALRRIYTAQESWSELVELDDHHIERNPVPRDRAKGYLRMAELATERLHDVDRGEHYLKRSLEADPTFEDVKWRLAERYFERGEFPEAVRLLHDVIDLNDDTQRLDLWRSYFDGLTRDNELVRADAVGAAILRRDASLLEVHEARASLLDTLGDTVRADAAWRAFLEQLGPAADGEHAIRVLLRVAEGAERRESYGEAVVFLERACELDEDRTELLQALREAVAKSGDEQRAATLLEREARLASDEAQALTKLRKAAAIFANLGENEDELRIIEQLRTRLPDDVALLRRVIELVDDQERFFELSLELERLVGLAELDVSTLQLLADRVDGEDIERANALYRELLAREPNDDSLRERVRDLALKVEDYPTYVRLEEEALSASAPAERAMRLKALAEIVAMKLRQPGKASRHIEQALELAPDDRTLRRTLADTYALDATRYSQAAALYRELLAEELFDTDLLRILARLYGQLGDTDRAFGHYAALRFLVPDDDEAKRFVDACRQVMPIAPPRPLTSTDRSQGLVHKRQLGPIEELFAPLARFAELAHPGDLKLRGVDERDRLAPTDPIAQDLSASLEAIGLSGAELYTWRGGGFVCELELVGRAAILLGSSLVDDAPSRQRNFLVVRAGELYRTGHTLCERLSSPQLEALSSALTLAVSPELKVPGVTRQSETWSKTIAAPMTDAIRAQLQPRAHHYVEHFVDVDIPGWRNACLCTATRTAMLVTTDIEEAMLALLRLRGFDDMRNEDKPGVLSESEEGLDLWAFALSDAYFKLRKTLGLALTGG